MEWNGIFAIQRGISGGLGTIFNLGFEILLDFYFLVFNFLATLSDELLNLNSNCLFVYLYFFSSGFTDSIRFSLM